MPNALITSSLTVAVGLVVYGATQFAQRFWLDPVTDLMKALGRAAYACVYYANVYSSPGVVRPELAQESSKELRKCASELLAALRAVRCYWVFRVLLRLLPPEAEIQEATRLLIGLSNASKVEDMRDAWKETDRLRQILGVRQ